MAFKFLGLALISFFKRSILTLGSSFRAAAAVGAVFDLAGPLFNSSSNIEKSSSFCPFVWAKEALTSKNETKAKIMLNRSRLKFSPCVICCSMT
ncbi:hypothetical protein D3C72_1500550 [compost metagenome]